MQPTASARKMKTMFPRMGIPKMMNRRTKGQKTDLKAKVSRLSLVSRSDEPIAVSYRPNA
jgi:hypothetical protein